MVMFDGKLVGKYTFSVSVCGKVLVAKKTAQVFLKVCKHDGKIDPPDYNQQFDIHQLIIKVR